VIGASPGTPSPSRLHPEAVPMSASRIRLNMLIAAAALTLCLGSPNASRAADPSPTPPILDRKLRATLIDSLCANLMRNYVEADTAKMIVDYVHSRMKARAYEALTSVNLFAEAVTKDLRHVNGDLHLSLRYDPNGAIPNGGAVIMRGP